MTPPSPSMLLVGGTGAVGKRVISHTLLEQTYEALITLGRRESNTSDPRHAHHVVDFEQIELHQSIIDARDVVCTLGTTIKKAGSRERFEAIDHGYPLRIAKLAKANGVERFVLVTSLGADARASNHYLRTKGRLEDDVIALGFESVVILRPSLLIGEREERRLGEEAGKIANRLFSKLIPRRYRGIDVDVIAQRIAQVGREAPKGVVIYESEQIPC